MNVNTATVWHIDVLRRRRPRRSGPVYSDFRAQGSTLPCEDGLLLKLAKVEVAHWLHTGHLKNLHHLHPGQVLPAPVIGLPPQQLQFGSWCEDNEAAQ